MIAVFCNESSVCPVLGLLAAGSYSPELAGQFVVPVLYQRHGMLRWPFSSIVAIIILYLDNHKGVSYKNKVPRGKRKSEILYVHDFVYPFEAHS